MPQAFRVLSRLQDLDDFQGSLVGGYYLKYNSGAGKFELGQVDLSAYALASDLSTHTGLTTTAHGGLISSSATRVANTILAGPTTGADAAPTFRALVAADIPSLASVYVPIAQMTGGGVVATGGFTLTVPATGTAALLGTSNLFSVRQDIRASGSGLAQSLYIASTAADSLTTVSIGGTTTSFADAIALKVGNYSSSFALDVRNGYPGGPAGFFSGLSGVVANGTSGNGVEGRVSTGIALFGNKTSAANNTIGNVAMLQHDSSGTPADGFGCGAAFQLQSSTTAAQDAGRIAVKWATATHASRASQMDLSTYYTTTERVGLSIGSDASNPLIGFLGTAPISKPTVSGSRGANAALASLLTALANLGLVTDSSS